MREACSLIWSALVLLLRPRAALLAEILVLRHQINILRRHSPKRRTFSAMDRLIFAELYRLAPTVLNALAVLKPDTVIKWHLEKLQVRSTAELMRLVIEQRKP